MHTDGEDGDDDEEPPVKIRSESSDTDRADFDISIQPDMPSTPGQGPSMLTSPAPIDIPPASSAPPVINSLLSDDDQDKQDSKTDEVEHTTFPLFSADDVRKKFVLGVQESQRDNVDDVGKGRGKSRDGNNDESGDGDNGDGVGDLEGEMVGSGYATPPRYGGSNLRPISADSSDQERERAWSEVEQTVQELEREGATAVLASEMRKRRRQELMDAKRS